MVGAIRVIDHPVDGRFEIWPAALSSKKKYSPIQFFGKEIPHRAMEIYNSVMQQAARYFTSFNSARGRFGALPPVPRAIVGIFALPGIALLLLSIVLFLCSIFVLLLLTVPVYRVLQAVFGGRQPISEAGIPENPFVFSLFGQPVGTGDELPGRRQVEAKVTDAR